MPKSLSERAVDRVERLLRAVREADGYATDAGMNVSVARRSIDVDKGEHLVVWDNGERSDTPAGSPLEVFFSILVEQHTKVDQEETGRMLAKMKADVKRAVLVNSNGSLSDDLGVIGTIRYVQTTPNPRAEGSVSESISSIFEVRLKEGYGNPYSQNRREQ